MRPLRLPGASGVTPFVTLRRPTFRLISRLRSPSRGNRRADARVLLNRSHPLFRYFVPRTLSVLPSSLRTLLTFAVLSDPGRLLTPDPLYSAQMWSPQLLLRRRQPIMTFEALLHGFSHDCLRFVPSSGTTTQNSLPAVDQPSGWAFPCPLSSIGEFPTFALPSPRASLGAKQFSF